MQYCSSRKWKYLKIILECIILTVLSTTSSDINQTGIKDVNSFGWFHLNGGSSRGYKFKKTCVSLRVRLYMRVLPLNMPIKREQTKARLSCLCTVPAGVL